jgi:hypothetical protein
MRTFGLVLYLHDGEICGDCGGDGCANSKDGYKSHTHTHTHTHTQTHRGGGRDVQSGRCNARLSAGANLGSGDGKVSLRAKKETRRVGILSLASLYKKTIEADKCGGEPSFPPA